MGSDGVVGERVIGAVRSPLQCAVLLVLCGCAGSARMVEPAVNVRAGLVICRGDDGQVVGWDQVMDAVAGADVIVLGEEHDDPVGHGFQLAVV